MSFLCQGSLGATIVTRRVRPDMREERADWIEEEVRAAVALRKADLEHTPLKAAEPRILHLLEQVVISWEPDA